MPSKIICRCGRHKRPDWERCRKCSGTPLKSKKDDPDTYVDRKHLGPRKMEGGAFIERDPAQRQCLYCDKWFRSSSNENRICPGCKGKTELSSTWGDGYTYP